jgi:cephalosporin hydroxylase
MLLSENELNSQNLDEFQELLKEFIKIKPTKFIEIGSLYGWTLQHFIHYAEEGSKALSIDLPVRNFVGVHDWRVKKQEDNYKNVWPLWAKAKKCKLHLIPDSSQKIQTLEKTKEIFKEEKIDFLFIDGDHTYNGVKSDYEMYSSLVRKGGIIAFHDIGKNEEGDCYKFWNEIKTTAISFKEILIDTKQEKGIGILFL